MKDFATEVADLCIEHLRWHMCRGVAERPAVLKYCAAEQAAIAWG